MQLTIEDISPVEKRVEFELPWGEVGPRLDRAYESLRREVHLKGFRPGKAPRAVLEQLYRARVEDEVARELIELSIGQAIQDKQIEPVAPPTVDKLELKSGAPFRFSAKVEVRANVTPRDYTGIPLEAPRPVVGPEEVEQALAAQRSRLTQYVLVEGRSHTQDDDVVMVEVHGRVGSHKVKRREIVVDLADATIGPLPGLGPRLRGLPVDAKEHEVRFTIAEDAPAELAGQEVSLRVSLKQVRQRKVPELDDAFAKATGLAETLDGLRQVLHGELLARRKEAIRRGLGRALIGKLIERNDFPIAPSLVERHLLFAIDQLKAQMAMAGVEMTGPPPAELLPEMRADAEREARAQVLLQAIGEREGVEATEADLHKRIAEIAAVRGQSAKQVRGELEEHGHLPGLRRQLAQEKTLELLLSQAQITEVEPEALVVTPEQARKESGRKLIVSPEEAAREAAAAPGTPSSAGLVVPGK